MFKKT